MPVLKTVRPFLGVACGLALFVLSVPPVAAQSDEAPTPPTNLKLVGDHWTPWDPPEAGPEAYIIQKGDTLWDLAEEWLGDPFLWPQIWDENRYILDSHWIYPGDPLVIPGKPVVVPDEGPPVTEVPTDTPTEVPTDTAEEESPGFGREGEQPLEPAKPEAAPLATIAGPTDVYCTGYINPEPPEPELKIAGREAEKLEVAQGDVIYLNHGEDHGIRAGDEFAIQRQGRTIKQPGTGAVLGQYVRRLGKVRVLMTQQSTAVAVIERACQNIHDGDELTVWAEIDVPAVHTVPKFERYDVRSSGGATGQIVATTDEIQAVGQGHVIHTDLGAAAGIRPGDVLTMFRDNGDLPRLNLGQAVVLTVEPNTSTVKVIQSVREMWIGDRVEVAQR